MGVNPPNPTYSDLPGTETASPTQDATEARRFPPSQQPFPRIPSIPAPKAQPKAAGGGGAFSMDTLMPLLMMAAPFLEAHQPGYGMGLVHGILQHQEEQAAVKRNTIMTMAHEFRDISEEQWPAVAAILKTQGLDPESISTIHGVIPALRSAGWAQQQELNKYTEFFRPELAQHAVTGLSMQDILSRAPERVEAARAAGLQVPGDIRTIQTGVTPGQPGAGELGTRTPPVAPQPITERRVMWPGQVAPPTYGTIFDKARGTPFEHAPMPTDARGVVNLKEASANMESIGLYEDPAKHKANLQTYLRGKLEAGLRSPGSVDLATLKSQMEAPGADMNFNVELMQARDKAAKAEAALPKPETIVLLNTRTGEQQTMTLPPGAKLHTFSPPNAPVQHTIIYPDGRREVLPPGMTASFAPKPEGGTPAQVEASKKLQELQVELAGYDAVFGRFSPQTQEAIRRYAKTPTAADLKILTGDATKVQGQSGASMGALDFATGYGSTLKKIEAWKKLAPPPGKGQPVPGTGSAQEVPTASAADGRQIFFINGAWRTANDPNAPEVK